MFGSVGIEELKALRCFFPYGVRSDDGNSGYVPGGTWEGVH